MIYFVRDEATLLVKIGFTERGVDDRPVPELLLAIEEVKASFSALW
jgi:hypothetical protein